MEPLVKTTAMESIMTSFALQIGHSMGFHAQNTVTYRARFHPIKFFVDVLFPKKESIKDATVLAI
jgi:hypothetical protein